MTSPKFKFVKLWDWLQARLRKKRKIEKAHLPQKNQPTCENWWGHINTINLQWLYTNTVFIRLTALGGYSIFGPGESSIFERVSYYILIGVFVREGVVGLALIRGWALINFSAFKMGAYSRWALIRGWALIRINMVVLHFLFVWKDFHARSHEGIMQLLSPHQFVGG